MATFKTTIFSVFAGLLLSIDSRAHQKNVGSWNILNLEPSLKQMERLY